jgi:RNA polymerase sigma factor (sigma-70 family)
MDKPDTNTPHRRDRGAGGRRRRTPEHPHGAGSRTTQHTPAVITDAELEAWRAMTAADTQLRETLLGLPSMIGLVLHVAHKKQLAKILDEADAATHGALERHLLALHAYLREWAALETTAHMRAQIADEVASLLAPFAFSRGFLLQAAQALTAPPRDPSLQLAPEVQATAVQRVTAARATLAQAVETLVLLHLPFVERFSRSFVAVYRRYGRHLEPTDQLDLFQEGCVGLLRAAWRYNPQHNTRFWTYARHWVHQALGRLVPKLGAVVVTPERVRAQHKTIARTKQRLSTFLDRDPDARELALALGLPLSQGRLTADLPPRCISTETPIGDGELTLGDVLIDPRGEEWLIQLEHEDGGEDDQ